MKIAKRLLPLLLVILAILGFGCSHREKSAVEKVIKNELDLLKNLDSDTTQKYISYKELFPDATKDTDLSEEIQEVFSLFFQDFDYKILDVDVDKNKETAQATLRLTTLDAHSLAKDFSGAQLKQQILEAAASQNTEDNTVSLEKRYFILNELLNKNDYEAVESNCTIGLKNTVKEGTKWEIKRTYTLENNLVGGLMTYLTDPDILSPEDTLAVYLKTLKKMNKEEMSNYLGVESILNTEDSNRNAIALALVEQVHTHFDYKVADCRVDGYKAVIEAEITTFDSNAILKSYQKELDTYLASPEAVIDGFDKRFQKSYDMLLANIQDNTAACTVPAVFHLTNDGVSWRLDDSSTLGDAIFGTLNISPVENEETGEAEAEEE